MVAIKNKLNNKSVTPELDENKLINSKLDDLQACINKLNNIIDKLIKAKVVSYLNDKAASYSSQHPYSYYPSQRSKANEDTADPAEEALEKVREED